MIKDILVHLDGIADDELRLQHAEAVASASEGHLTGLFTNPLADLTAVMPLDGGGRRSRSWRTSTRRHAGKVTSFSSVWRSASRVCPFRTRFAGIDGTPGQLRPCRLGSALVRSVRGKPPL